MYLSRESIRKNDNDYRNLHESNQVKKKSRKKTICYCFQKKKIKKKKLKEKTDKDV